MFTVFPLANSKTYKDKSLKKSDAPAFLVNAVPKVGADDIEYFKKTFSDGTISYEVKYEIKDEEVSVHYSDNGTFLEKEEDIQFSSLDESTRKKIESHLSGKYEKYRLLETEIRTTKDGKKLIDVEVAHKKNTGLTEFSYTPDGDYVSEEVEEVPQIETLN